MVAVTEAALQVKQLSVQRGTAQVVHGVSFALERGASIGIVGESGCGKSSILRAVAGIDTQWSGAMAIDGQPLLHQRQLVDRRAMQMVFQDPLAALNPSHTIDEILREPLIVHRMDRHEERIAKALETVALSSALRFRLPGQLSGGQRQRVCIARALLVEPKVLLLDEPTSALDVSVQAEVLNLLSRVRQQYGTAFVMVSHDLHVVAHMCERIAFMVHGRFVDLVTRDELLAGQLQSPEAKRLLEAAMHV